MWKLDLWTDFKAEKKRQLPSVWCVPTPKAKLAFSVIFAESTLPSLELGARCEKKILLFVLICSCQCCLFGDSLTIGSENAFLQKLLEYLEECSDYRSLFQGAVLEERRKAVVAVAEDRPQLLSETWVEEMRALISQFVLGELRRLDFEAQLSAAQRRAIHEVCEEQSVKLYHQSFGEDNKRVLCVVSQERKRKN
jgi:hypothetical protein